MHPLPVLSRRQLSSRWADHDQLAWEDDLAIQVDGRGEKARCQLFFDLRSHIDSWEGRSAACTIALSERLVQSVQQMRTSRLPSTAHFRRRCLDASLKHLCVIAECSSYALTHTSLVLSMDT